MPNWCSNSCTLEGTEEKLSAFFDALEKLSTQEQETKKGQIFEGIEYPKSTHIWMFDIAADRDANHFQHSSKWGPINEAMRLTSKHFEIEITIQYEELSNAIFGEVKYKNGEELYDACLEFDDINLEYAEEKGGYVTPEGDVIESQEEYYEEKLNLLIPEI